MELGAVPFDISQIAGARHDGATARAAAALHGQAGSEAARRVAEEFEAVFIAQMLTPMFETLETDGLFGGGPGAEIYRSMMVEEYSKTIARAGGLGIADAVQRELLGLQEVPSK